MSSERRSTAILVAAATAALLFSAAGRGAAPRFYPDDPLLADNDRVFDAGGALPVDASDTWDFAEQTFLKRGERVDKPAVNTNTMDEVPDSTWFVNRIGRRPMSFEEIVGGPNRTTGVEVDGWPIVAEKEQGVTPGYRVLDPSGRMWQLKFDPPDNPEMASGAEVIGAALYHAFGYNTVEGYLVTVDPRKIVIDPAAMTTDAETGRRRPLTKEDILRLLERAAKHPDGSYRAVASRFADGQPLGNFKYYGTRPDDPNDVFPHEHRRELRGARVFAAWLNHDDSRGLNSLDMLQGPEGRQFIHHYMFDFGSILGSGTTRAQAPRAGYEYLFEWRSSLLTLATLGLYVKPWMLVDYPEVARSVGRFESRHFDPEGWKPEYPNPAFDNMRLEDSFWAARIVSRFSDEAIQAVVAKARFTEPGAADYVARTIIERRQKVLRTWLTAVNPLADPRLDASGTLEFEDSAAAAGIVTGARYLVGWQHFDNVLGEGEIIGSEVEVREPRARAPLDALDGREFVSVSVRTLHPDYPQWAQQPVKMYFRREGAGWRAVGLERRGL